MSALFGTYARSEIAFERGEGMRLFSRDGDSYLDFLAGIGVNALGYGDPHVTGRLKEQAEKLWHTSNLFTIEQAELLATRLAENTFADAVFFTNSGAEAVECAIKTARRHFFDAGQEERQEIIAFHGAFHGRTLATIAAGGNPKYTQGFGTPLPGFVHVDVEDIAAVKAHVGSKTAAILIEPIQGEGGINVVSNEFLCALRDICDANGLLLIVDEIQCGFGRSGRFFAHEWAGITPDLMAVAKGIGAGFPLGACLATEEVARSMVPGTHGSTFGGNPLACAVGNAVLDRILEPGFIPHVQETGEYLDWQLRQLMQKYPRQILEVRGRGLMAGIRMAEPAGEFVARLRDNRLLTAVAGQNVVRLLPPLIASKRDVDEAIGIIDATLKGHRVQTGNDDD